MLIRHAWMVLEPQLPFPGLDPQLGWREHSSTEADAAAEPLEWKITFVTSNASWKSQISCGDPSLAALHCCYLITNPGNVEHLSTDDSFFFYFLGLWSLALNSVFFSLPPLWICMVSSVPVAVPSV